MNDDAVICDVCHQSCRPKSLDDEYCNGCEIMEYITLKGYWGYYSENPNRDLQYHECNICQPCYEKIRQFIESLDGKIRKYHYDICSGNILEEIE